MLARWGITGAMRKGNGMFQHKYTYIGHSVAVATTLVVQKVIQCDDLLAPPTISTHSDLEQIAEILATSIQQAIDSVKK